MDQTFGTRLRQHREQQQISLEAIARDTKIKQSVKEEYTKISEKSGATGCCGPAAGSTSNSIDYTIFSDDYSDLEGYNPDADLNLGCGLPTEFAKIKLGDTVVDLGSGAGNDAGDITTKTCFLLCKDFQNCNPGRMTKSFGNGCRAYDFRIF